MASWLATAFTTSGWLSHQIRKSPPNDTDNPSGSVAVSVAVTTTGSASAGLIAFQSAASSARKNRMSQISPPLTSRLKRMISVSTSWLWWLGDGSRVGQLVAVRVGEDVMEGLPDQRAPGRVATSGEPVIVFGLLR